MNTPAHVALNALVLGRGRFQPHWLAITAGALLPDLPMLGFYGYQRIALGTPERVIWGQLYFDPSWQALFDAFNSLPLIALAALFAWRAGSTAALAFLASMALHCLADLPLHREDAHAHFWPLTSWRFMSPISYWDPRHGGLVFLALELAMIAAAPFVLRRRSRAWGWVGGVTLACSVLFGLFAALSWSGALRSPALPEETRMADSERRQRGVEMMKKVYAGDVVTPPAGVMPFSDLMLEQLFAEVWTREALPVRDRRLVLLGIIGALGEKDTFQIQVKAALKNGELTPAQVREVVITLANYAGYPRAAAQVAATEQTIAAVEKETKGS